MLLTGYLSYGNLISPIKLDLFQAYIAIWKHHMDANKFPTKQTI